MEYKKLRIIISGGGTGGHIFPAISIANKLRELNPESEILFVGAEGKMEMEKVPAAGYKIIGLPIVGLQRQLNLKNLWNDIQVPFKVLASIRKAGKVIDSFRPDIAIGVGGYASAPLLWAAQRRGIPCLIQEQNGFAGLTNKILGKKAGCICVAYEGMERFFPADRIVLSGNPIRSDIVPADTAMVMQGIDFYGLDATKDHIFIVGGSLGSGTLNKAMKRGNSLDLYFTKELGDYPWRKADLAWFRARLREQWPDEVRSYNLGGIWCESVDFEDLANPALGNSGKPADYKFRPRSIPARRQFLIGKFIKVIDKNIINKGHLFFPVGNLIIQRKTAQKASLLGSLKKRRPPALGDGMAAGIESGLNGIIF